MNQVGIGIGFVIIEQHAPFEEINKLTPSSLKDHFSLFLSRWNDLKVKERSLKYILLSNNLLSLLGSVFVHNVLTSLRLSSLTQEETEKLLGDDRAIEALANTIKEQASSMESTIQHPRGYIVANEKDIIEDGKVVCKDYQDFAPFSVTPNEEGLKILEITSFNDCIDQYFVNDENYRVYLNFQK